MSDDDILRRSFVPPPRKQPHLASASELLALRVIVTKLVALKAETNTDGLVAQDWVNALAADCASAVLKAEFGAPQGFDVNQFRAEALDKINEILSGIQVTKNSSGAN
jgi:hypothetical protein